MYEAVDSGLRSRAVLTESDLKDMVGKAFKSVWKTYADWASEFEDPRAIDFIIDLALVHEKVTELYKGPASRPGYIE